MSQRLEAWPISSSPDSQMILNSFIISTADINAGTWSDPVYFPFNGIDPDIFFDDDGRAYIQGSWQIGDRLTQPTTTIKQYDIDVASGKQLSELREIWGGHTRYDTEGPHIYKRGKWYYLLVAEGGTFEHHMLSIARSMSLSGPYETFEETPIMTADGKEEYVQNVGHGDLFQDTHGRWWAVVLGVRNEDSWGLGRETFLTSVDWPEGGWPTVTQPCITFERETIELAGATKHDSEAAAGLSAADELGYVYIRNPDLSKYRFNAKNGAGADIILFPSSGGLSSPNGALTLLGRRQRALHCSAITEVDIQSNLATRGLKAGLALYKDHLRHASITYDFGTGDVSYNLTNVTKHLTRASRHSLSCQPKKLVFRIDASPTRYALLFHEAGGSGPTAWHELGSYETCEMFAREMTGPLFGIFAQGEPGSGSARDGVVFSGIQILGR